MRDTKEIHCNLKENHTSKFDIGCLSTQIPQAINNPTFNGNTFFSQGEKKVFLFFVGFFEYLVLNYETFLKT